MIHEIISFTPNIAGITYVLDDPNLIVDFAFFQVSINGSTVNAATGFTDGTKNRGKYCLDDTIKYSERSTTYSIYMKKNSGGVPVNALRGKSAANWNATPGEFVLDFDTADTAYTIDGYVVGHH